MQAIIGKINKRINSTKSSFSGNTHNVVMKDPQSRQAPTFLVTGAPMQGANYMSFNGWYYWIDDVVSETNNMYQIRAHVDPLATWKSAIQSTNAFVNFGPKSLNDSRVSDPRLTADIVKSTGAKDESFDFFDAENGCVIMTVLSMDDNIGSCGTYTICGSLTDFYVNLYLYATGLSGDLEQLSLDFEKLICKFVGLSGAADYIKSAVWVPVKKSSIRTNGSFNGAIGPYPIYGSWDKIVVGNAVQETKTVEAVLDDIVGTYPWLKSPQYMNLNIATPAGAFDISNGAYAKTSATSINLTCTFHMNCNGDCILSIFDNSIHTMVATGGFNIGIDLTGKVANVPSAFEMGVKGGVQVGVGAVAAVATVGTAMGAKVMSGIGNAVGNAGLAVGSERVMNAGIGIIDYAAEMAPNENLVSGVTTMSNGIGGIVAGKNVNSGGVSFGAPNNSLCLFINQLANNNIRLSVQHYVPTIIKEEKYEDFCNRYGWPVLNYATLSSGYYQCAGASVSCDAPPDCISLINSTCNSGIYVE